MTAEAVAVNVAVVAPDGTRTEAGTVNAEATLLESKTVAPPLGAAFEIVIVQEVEPDAASLVLPHCMEVIEMGACSERLAVVLTAFKLAVTDAV